MTKYVCPYCGNGVESIGEQCCGEVHAEVGEECMHCGETCVRSDMVPTDDGQFICNDCRSGLIDDMADAYQEDAYDRERDDAGVDDE